MENNLNERDGAFEILQKNNNKLAVNINERKRAFAI
jgi:hypothetical protein